MVSLYLRHAFGTGLAEGSFSEATSAEFMGHTDAKTTKCYKHSTDRAKQAVVETVIVSGEKACHNPAPNEKRPSKVIAANS